MSETVKSMLQRMPREERALFTPERLREIRAHFSTLSERWSALKIGEGFTAQW